MSGERLCVGFSSGDNVSDLFKSPGEFQGGTIEGVDGAVEGKPYIDLEAEAKRIMMTP
ncbi:hypothetical protein [Algibacter mikhailovii]|uniref:Uncharacterized protein n=1 Tax=Algibacter mikhailovii TaxID=425498 RepID=A0A918V977_9FLAO|nr:hypothetical protein [Algibacter mikhailovii]GGZ80783.1 hypothetical protein GCM10007028_17670 [Algibacter mikhailovii]